MNIPTTYDEAFPELQSIATAIQNNKISVDDLAEKVTRASKLVQLCQDKLNGAEAQVNAVIEGLNQSPSAEPPF